MNLLSQLPRYRIGIDVGENSVGLAAISYDDDDHVIEILSAVSYIHDGGKLSGTDKAPLSRLAGAGVARRTRRLRRRATARLKKLNLYLEEQSFPPELDSQTYEVWHARYQLVHDFIQDEAERNFKLALVIRHIARHRGWRNPWWTFSQVQRAADEKSPSPSLLKMWENAALKYSFPDHEICSVGVLGYLGVTKGNPNRRLRHSTAEERKNRENIFFDQIMAEDNFAELSAILVKQKIDIQVSTQILKLVFEQKMPHVPKDRVGDDSLDPSQKRSTRAGLEFQRVRMLNAISNLRIAEAGINRPLDSAEFDRTLTFLTDWKDKSTKPNQSDVAHLLGHNPAKVKFPTWDDHQGSIAFFDQTSLEIINKFPEKEPLGAWWRQADFLEKSDFVDFITDNSEEAHEDDAPFLDLLEEESTAEALGGLKLTSGRAAYSRKTYQRILLVMEEQHCSEREAIIQVFQIKSDWQPPLPDINDPIEHPTVDRVLTVVRRFSMACNSKWGIPESITVEHVRDAFIGPASLSKLKYDIAQRTQKNEQIREELRASSSGKIRKSDLRRYKQIQRQNSQCLYCGTTLIFESCQLDHIVPQSDGGSNREENLVAVCTHCNKSKNALPFITWAASGAKDRVSLEGATTRLKTWDRGKQSKTQWTRFLNNVQSRLTLTSEDDSLDERSLGSTAYAAVEVRNRLTSLYLNALSLPAEKCPEIRVYSGAINSIARRSSGIDDFLQLRGKAEKNRLDRRHHAIDAAMLTTLNDSVAVTLAKKNWIKRSEESTGGKTTRWKEFEGSSPLSTQKYHHWKTTCSSLADEVKRSVDLDKIAVVRPLRIGPASGEGAVHDDTIQKLEVVETIRGLTSEQVRRLSHPILLNKVWDHLETDMSLTAENSVRVLGEKVKLFCRPAAQIAVRGGSCQIGNSVHHARIYAFRKKDGFGFGWIRVFAGEFPHIGFSKKGVDVLRQPLPHSSQAMLKANPTLLKLIQSGQAKEIGWITRNDEVEFDLPEKLTDPDESDEGILFSFLRNYPERRWIITGLESADNLKISPSILSSEGLTKEHSELVTNIISRKKYVRSSVNQFLLSPNLKIIRRSILGVPRWNDRGLPFSWEPLRAAQKIFGD
jgi:CRISPR-associated endonuclease Csn1